MIVVHESHVLNSENRCSLANFYDMNPGIINSNTMSGVFGDNSFLLKIKQIVMSILFQSAEEYAKK